MKKYFFLFWITLLSIVCWYWVYLGTFNENWINPFSDIWDYAQQARELYRGHGFTSLFTYPIVLPYTQDGLFYNLWRPPVYPYMVSLIFRCIGGPSIHGLVYLNGIFYVLTCVLVAGISEKLFNRQTAWIAGILYIFSLNSVHYSISGLSEPVFVFLVTLFFFQFYQYLSQPSVRKWVNIRMGILLGLGLLLRSEMIFFLPAVIYFLWRVDRLRRKGDLILVLFIAVLLMIPWWVRNYRITGNPFFNMSTNLVCMFTPSYPGWSRFRMITQSNNLIEFIWTHSSEISIKFIKLLIHNLWNLFCLHTPMVLLFVASIWKTHSSPIKKLRIFVCVCIIIHCIGVSFLESDIRFFLCYLPIIIILGTDVLIRGCYLINTLSNFRKQWLMPIIVLILILPTFIWWKSELSKEKTSKTQRFFGLSEYVSQHTLKESVLVTDIPDKMAWYMDRHTIWLPELNDLSLIQQKYSNIDGIILTPAILSLTSDPEVVEWRTVYNNHNPITGFDLIYTFPDGTVYYQKGKLL